MFRGFNGRELRPQPIRAINCCLHLAPLSLFAWSVDLLPVCTDNPLFKRKNDPAFAGVTLRADALDKDFPSTCWRVAGATRQPRRTTLNLPPTLVTERRDALRAGRFLCAFLSPCLRIRLLFRWVDLAGSFIPLWIIGSVPEFLLLGLFLFTCYRRTRKEVSAR